MGVGQGDVAGLNRASRVLDICYRLGCMAWPLARELGALDENDETFRSFVA